MNPYLLMFGWGCVSLAIGRWLAKRRFDRELRKAMDEWTGEAR